MNRIQFIAPPVPTTAKLDRQGRHHTQPLAPKCLSRRRAGTEARSVLRIFCCCALVVSLWSLLAEPVSAEMLLTTITMPGHVYDPGVQPPTRMGFGILLRQQLPHLSVGFLNEYEPHHVGTVYEAPSTLVAQMAPYFSDPNAEIDIGTMTDNVELPVAAFWNLSQFITPSVSQLGVGLEGYLVTRITQTVDYITWSTETGRLAGNAQQSVRLYGELVPEATALQATAITCLCLIGRFLRKCH